MNTATPQDDTLQIFERILQIKAGLHGPDYIRQLAQNITATLDVDYVVISHNVSNETNLIETDVIWNGQDFLANFSYDIIETPCHDKNADCRQCNFHQTLAREIPQEAGLTDIDADGCIGAPILDRDGKMNGSLIFLCRKPVDNPDYYAAIARFLAPRVGIEIERHQMEAALKAELEDKTQELERKIRFVRVMVEHMSDGVIACDENGEMILSNKAARKYFSLPRDHDMEAWARDVAIEHAQDRSSINIRDSLFLKTMDSIELRDEDFLVHSKGRPSRLLRANGHVIADVDGKNIGAVISLRDITEKKQEEERIERLAMFDELTGLPNRRMLIDRLQQELSAAIRHHSHGALMFLDLDQFKTLNDTLGHSVGDELLKQVAERLKKVVREEDTVARLGGDEFVVILSQLDDDETIAINSSQSVAQKILEALCQPYDLRGYNYNITSSIGIVLFPTAGEHLDTLLKHADGAMYRAKAEGRGRYCYFNSEMQEKANRRLSIEKDLTTIIENNEFEVHFQPIVNYPSNVIIGAEALSRWSHPTHGWISPAEFIPVAEDTGMIQSIGNWVLMHALRSLKHWINTGHVSLDMVISVNVSPRQFREPSYVQDVLRALNIFDIPPRHLKLEITEGLLLHDMEESIAKMNELRRHGVRFSIDDFGTGYSSLDYLKKLPFEQIKIDQTFVQNIQTNPDDAVIAKTIISIAEHFNLETLAEGVENEEQIKALVEMGCHNFQGFYFSRPIGSNDFLKWLKKWADDHAHPRASQPAVST